MRPLHVPTLTPLPSQALDHRYRTTTAPRLRTRAHMVLRSAAHGRTVATVAALGRERAATVLRWRTRHLAEGRDGWHEAPHPGRPSEVTEAYRAARLAAVRRRPRRVGRPCARWTLHRLVADLAAHTRMRGSDETVRRALQPAGMVRSRPPPQISRPDPADHVQNSRVQTPAIRCTPVRCWRRLTHAPAGGGPRGAPCGARGASTA
jgi:transposase